MTGYDSARVRPAPVRARIRGRLVDVASTALTMPPGTATVELGVAGYVDTAFGPMPVPTVIALDEQGTEITGEAP